MVWLSLHNDSTHQISMHIANALLWVAPSMGYPANSECAAKRRKRTILLWLQRSWSRDLPAAVKRGSIKPLRSSLFSSPPRCEVRNISHQINCAKTLYSKLCLGKNNKLEFYVLGSFNFFLAFIVNVAVSGVFTPDKLFMGFQRGAERPGEAKIPV